MKNENKMNQEKSSVEILKQIAKHADWEISVQEVEQHYRAGNTLRNVLIKNAGFKDFHFISAQCNNFSNYRLYSGIFVPVSFKYDYKLLIRKRDSLDKLSFRKNKLRFKIGNGNFDSKVLIETNNDIETHKLLSNSGIQKEILEYINSQDGLYIGINEINPDYTADLEGKKFLSVFLAMEWMLSKDIIDKSFKLAETLNNKINK